MEKRNLGRTKFDASIMGLGGEGLLRSQGKDKEAYALINKALDLGINFLTRPVRTMAVKSTTARRFGNEERMSF